LADKPRWTTFPTSLRVRRAGNQGISLPRSIAHSLADDTPGPLLILTHPPHCGTLHFVLSKVRSAPSMRHSAWAGAQDSPTTDELRRERPWISVTRLPGLLLLERRRRGSCVEMTLLSQPGFECGVFPGRTRCVWSPVVEQEAQAAGRPKTGGITIRRFGT
jgi:hypothetical protein